MINNSTDKIPAPKIIFEGKAMLKRKTPFSRIIIASCAAAAVVAISFVVIVHQPQAVDETPYTASVVAAIDTITTKVEYFEPKPIQKVKKANKSVKQLPVSNKAEAVATIETPPPIADIEQQRHIPQLSGVAASQMAQSTILTPKNSLAEVVITPVEKPQRVIFINANLSNLADIFSSRGGNQNLVIVKNSGESGNKNLKNLFKSTTPFGSNLKNLFSKNN